MNKLKTPLLYLFALLLALAAIDALLLLSAQPLLSLISPLDLMLSADVGALILIALVSLTTLKRGFGR